MAKSDVYSMFTVERIGTLSGTIDSVAVSYTSGAYSHVALTLPSPFTSPSVLATALTASLSGGAHTVVVAWSKTSLVYTLTGSGNFALASMSTTLNAALGYPTFGGTIGGSTSGHAVYTSSVRPLYVHLPVMTGQSSVSPKLEAEGRTTTSVSDGGVPYGISSIGVAQTRQWTHNMELRAAPAAIATRGTPLDTEDATTLIPWSWQHWRNHVLGHEVFALYDPTGTAAEFYMLEASSTSHRPTRITADYDALFAVPVSAYYLGAQS